MHISNVHCFASSVYLNICVSKDSYTNMIDFTVHSYYMLSNLHPCVCMCSVEMLVCRSVTLSPVKLGMNKQKIAVMMWPRCPGCRSPGWKWECRSRPRTACPSPSPSAQPGTQSQCIAAGNMCVCKHVCECVYIISFEGMLQCIACVVGICVGFLSSSRYM